MANKRKAGTDWRFKRQTLGDVLADLVLRAEQTEGRAAVRCLSRGLWVSVKVLPHAAGVELVISRPDVYPSLVEWAAVCGAWPWKFKVNYDPERVTGLLGLRAVLPLRPAVVG